MPAAIASSSAFMNPCGSETRWITLTHGECSIIGTCPCSATVPEPNPPIEELRGHGGVRGTLLKRVAPMSFATGVSLRSHDLDYLPHVHLARRVRRRAEPEPRQPARRRRQAGPRVASWRGVGRGGPDR